MTNPAFDTLLGEFERAIQDCQRLYLSSAQLCVQKYTGFIPGSPDRFHELMEDLHKGVLIKVYVTVVQADTRWTTEEKRLAERLFQHLWPGGVPGGKLRETANHVFREAGRLKWLSLVRPFQQIVPLRDRAAELETLIERIAMLVARADEEPTATELAAIRSIQQELGLYLHPIDEIKDLPSSAPIARSKEAVQQLQQESKELAETFTIDDPVFAEPVQTSEERLNEALTNLDQLIGLLNVKHEIRTLTNFLKMQQQRVCGRTAENQAQFAFGLQRQSWDRQDDRRADRRPDLRRDGNPAKRAPGRNRSQRTGRGICWPNWTQDQQEN